MDIVITYETLFDILRKEKSREELQDLPDNFYEEALAFLRSKMESVSSSSSNSNSFYRSKEEIQVRNIKKILKELYERRERKIINLAIDNGRIESMIINKDSMTPGERELFEKSLKMIRAYKHLIIGPVITGSFEGFKPFKNTFITSKEENGAFSEPHDYNLNDKEEVSSNNDDSSSPATFDDKAEIKSSSPVDNSTPEKAIEIKLSNDGLKSPSTGAGSGERFLSKENVSSSQKEDVREVGGVRVLITAKLPKFLGPNGEVLGPFDPDTEAVLPEKVAFVLEKKGKAKIL